ncbi:MAG: LLM class flavin-dependent oxidoreductase [Rhodospirillaceae bacterium]|jgi:5,10-methylenetetrahydromethanopterin reductase|nr:LLM class flavin-dependent oxidoreductase [Rhodospirillaceae bacterium]MBT5458609.1 LLM class flavin-dependent oxidoreductase [Rhodospirillaceae bacterium]
MALRLGMRFDGFDPVSETVEVATQAEAAGANTIWMAEHLGYREAAVSCMAFLQKTSRAMVCPTAVMPYLWHPMPTAMQFATMAELAPGRVGICISVGNLLNLRESGVEKPEKPVRVIREYVEALRALWAGETVEQEGVIWQLRGARLAFTPPEPIPIFVASTGPQVLGLAGRIADGVLYSGGLSLASIRKSAVFAEEGLKKADRDPSAFRRAGFVYFACSEDGKTAIESNRRKIAFLFRNSAQADNIASVDVSIDHGAIMDLVKQRKLEEAAQMVPPEAVPQFTVAGTPKECRDQLQAYIDAGVDEPVIEVSGSEEEKRLALDVIREFTGG